MTPDASRHVRAVEAPQESRRTAVGAAPNMMPVGIAVLVGWLCAVIGILITLPDYERYHSRVERTERLLRTHCSGWTLVKDADYIPTHELLVKKCVPK